MTSPQTSSSQLDDMPMVLDQSPDLVDQFRRLRRFITRSQDGRRDVAPVVLFTGSSSGEGVSTVLVNLAVHAAEEGERVIMVDANFHRPALAGLFGLPESPGLGDLILGTSSLDEAIQATHKERLSLVACGSERGNPSGLLKYPGLSEIFDAMRKKADLVLVDAPPVNQYVDAGLVAGVVDQVYIVIQAEKTRWEAVSHAREVLTDYGAMVKGSVLNRRRLYIPRWLYRRL